MNNIIGYIWGIITLIIQCLCIMSLDLSFLQYLGMIGLTILYGYFMVESTRDIKTKEQEKR